jgi:AcrR family transcriptional regulator
MKKIPKASGAPTAPRKPRGRPRSFDREQALEQAMEVFWAKGFEGTSIADLTQAMGINPPSLYAAFGDKEKLFLQAVERYTSRRGEDCPYCKEVTARGAVEKLLLYMADELTSEGHPPGCMMMMAAATSASASQQMQAILAQKRAGSRTMLKTRIERGIKEGDVPRETNAAELADFYSTVMSGMALLARDGATRKSLHATVENAMRLFPSSHGNSLGSQPAPALVRSRKVLA